MRLLRPAPPRRGELMPVPQEATERNGRLRPSARRTRALRRILSEPRSPADSSVRSRSGVLGTVARVLTAMGVLSLVFGLFQSNIADISERRSQRAVRSLLAEMLETGAGFPRDPSGKQIPIPPGSPVAALDIPKIDLHKAVVEGADAEILKKGPGVTSNSVLPGQPGQSIIIGRRTTFGAPFRQLDMLRSGDEIRATTPMGKFRYEVREIAEVDPGTATEIREARGSLLTLVTSHPPGEGGEALIVDAVLAGDPSTFPDPPRSLAGDEGVVAFSGNSGSAFGTIIAGVLLLTALLAADRMYRRWRRWPTYLLTTPVILALAFAWMENLSSLFPSSL